ncbi:MAG: ATP-binding cassette domain-containing protein, partial [Candidatus Limnocylindrales bacterium]
MSTASAALALHDVSKRYGRSGWALHDVTVELAAGSITALVGPNGAGKTTLLRIWAGFERPTRGTATVFGGEPSAASQVERRAVCFMPQQPALYGQLSVSDHIVLARHWVPGFDAGGTR